MKSERRLTSGPGSPASPSSPLGPGVPFPPCTSHSTSQKSRVAMTTDAPMYRQFISNMDIRRANKGSLSCLALCRQFLRFYNISNTVYHNNNNNNYY